MANSPIQEFFAQGSQGNSRLWTWLAVFWFALVLWFFGQIILGIPISLIGVFSDPDASRAMIEQQAQMDLGESAKILAIMAGIVISSLIAIASFLIGGGIGDRPKKPFMIIAAMFALISFGFFVLMFMMGQDPAQMEMLNLAMAKSPLVYAFMLLMFPPFAIGLWLGVKYIQKRPLLSLHTAHKKFRWGRVWFAAILVWLVWGVFAFIGHISGVSKVEFVFDAGRFFWYLPFTLLLIPLQSATEEIALRGYLNQGIGQYIKNPWVVFTLTSAGFAALHLGNPEVTETMKEHSVFIALGGYFAFGMFASLMTLIDGGLESAIGMHAANNIFAAAIIGYDNSVLPTPTIFNIGLDSKLDTIMVIIGLSVVCFILYMTRRPLEPAKTSINAFD